MTFAVWAAAGIAAAQEPSAPPTAWRLSLESAADAVGQGGAASTSRASAARVRAELSHARGTRRANLNLWGGFTADHTWTPELTRGVAMAATVDSNVTLSRRTRLTFAERLSASPLDLFTAFGSGEAAVGDRAVGSDSELRGTRVLAHSARVSAIRTLGPRSEATIGATHTFSATGRDRVASGAVTGRLARRTGAFGGWHAGYGYVSDAIQRGAERERRQRHDLDVGFDYSRPLSLSRHTTVAITTGSTVLVEDAARSVRISATGAVGHQLSRWWAVRADYARPIQFVAGFAEPLLSDAVRAALTGRLSRDLVVSATAGVATGRLGIAEAARFSSTTTSIRVARRLGVAWEFEAEYHDSRYRFNAVTPLAGAIPAAFVRRGVRTGFVWTPVAAR